MLYPMARHNRYRSISILKVSLICRYVFGFAAKSRWIVLGCSVPKQWHVSSIPLSAVFETYSETFPGYMKGNPSSLREYISQEYLKKDVQILSANGGRCRDIYSKVGVRQPCSHGLVNENHGGVPCPRLRIPMRLQASIIDATRSQLQ